MVLRDFIVLEIKSWSSSFSNWKPTELFLKADFKYRAKSHSCYINTVVAARIAINISNILARMISF